MRLRRATRIRIRGRRARNREEKWLSFVESRVYRLRRNCETRLRETICQLYFHLSRELIFYLKGDCIDRRKGLINSKGERVIEGEKERDWHKIDQRLGSLQKLALQQLPKK